ncbi:MAG: translation initiation factor IF-3 [bacterium]
MPFIAKPEENVRVNEEIKESEVRLVKEDGDQVGVLSMDEAIKKAKEADKDLVEVAPKADPVVVKLMDYGKYKYEQQKERQRQKQSQETMELKQLRLKPQIADHDLSYKLNDAQGFLENNNKVKFQVLFRGREITRPEMGEELLDKVKERLEDHGKITKQPQLEGKTMTMVMEPKSSKN